MSAFDPFLPLGSLSALLRMPSLVGSCLGQSMELLMGMTFKRAVTLVEQNAHIHREVLALIDAGELKIILRGEDITDVERVRIQNNLNRELQLIEAFGGCGD